MNERHDKISLGVKILLHVDICPELDKYFFLEKVIFMLEVRITTENINQY
jgi:hypothetical protein